MPRKAPAYAPIVPEPPGGAGVCDDGMLTVREAAAFSRVSRAELWRRMDRGELAWSKPGRFRLIPRRALVEWLNSQMRTGGA